MKRHRKLMEDAKAIMQAPSMHTVFYCALAFNRTLSKQETELVNSEAANLLATFEETGIVPEYIESFMIDVLIGKIPVLNSSGRQINKKGKR